MVLDHNLPVKSHLCNMLHVLNKICNIHLPVLAHKFVPYFRTQSVFLDIMASMDEFLVNDAFERILKEVVLF